jgi:rSAM/selenodomain-associated transferase 2
MTISIIIPTLNEEENIGNLVDYLEKNKNASVLEIIVADGGSTDNTMRMAQAAGATSVKAPQKGRAIQMNYGASMAGGDIIYFIHADSLPPASYATDILQAVNHGFDIGRYRTRFLGHGWLLKINAFFTRFDWFVCHGGDQTLFITRELFRLLNGYDENLLIMEEYDLTLRAKRQGRYKIIPKSSIISTRKYDRNSWWQVQKANYIIVRQYKKGLPQEMLVKRYNELIKYTVKQPH